MAWRGWRGRWGQKEKMWSRNALRSRLPRLPRVIPLRSCANCLKTELLVACSSRIGHRRVLRKRNSSRLCLALAADPREELLLLASPQSFLDLYAMRSSGPLSQSAAPPAARRPRPAVFLFLDLRASTSSTPRLWLRQRSDPPSKRQRRPTKRRMVRVRTDLDLDDDKEKASAAESHSSTRRPHPSP